MQCTHSPTVNACHEDSSRRNVVVVALIVCALLCTNGLSCPPFLALTLSLSLFTNPFPPHGIFKFSKVAMCTFAFFTFRGIDKRCGSSPVGAWQMHLQFQKHAKPVRLSVHPRMKCQISSLIANIFVFIPACFSPLRISFLTWNPSAVINIFVWQALESKIATVAHPFFVWSWPLFIAIFVHLSLAPRVYLIAASFNLSAS